MPLIVSIFPKDSLSPKSLSEHFLGAKNLYLIMLVCGNSFSLHTPFPLQPSQAHEVVVVVGGGGQQTPKSSSSSQTREFKLRHKTRVSEGSIYSRSSFTQTISRQQGAAHLNIHTFLHLKASLLYFKGKVKDPPNPFKKNHPIIITIKILLETIRKH